MEDELFSQLYQRITRLAKPRGPGQQYSDATILLVYCWAVLHDRPTAWACQQKCWPPHQRYWDKPSPSRMSRRLRDLRVGEFLEQIERDLRPAVPAPLVKTIDAKPLPVGGYSKDKQAAWGQATKGKAKGYKLFALTDIHGIVTWEVHSMKVSEMAVAKHLIPHLDGAGYLLGDALYDTNPLHKLAGFCNHQLIAPRKRPRTGLGRRLHSPLRLRCLDLLEHRAHGTFGPSLYARRTGIERTFGHMTNFACGLGPLPNWVRTLRRVRRWVQVKIILNAIRLLLLREKQGLTA